MPSETETHEQQQQRVVMLVNRINETLAGLPEAEAKTALTLAVISAIVCTSGDLAEREGQAKALAAQVLDYVRRDDIVEWMEASIRWLPADFSGKPQ